MAIDIRHKEIERIDTTGMPTIGTPIFDGLKAERMNRMPDAWKGSQQAVQLSKGGNWIPAANLESEDADSHSEAFKEMRTNFASSTSESIQILRQKLGMRIPVHADRLESESSSEVVEKVLFKENINILDLVGDGLVGYMERVMNKLTSENTDCLSMSIETSPELDGTTTVIVRGRKRLSEIATVTHYTRVKSRMEIEPHTPTAVVNPFFTPKIKASSQE